ncbi:MAG: hypothetical protein SGI74_04265 [Oligoflexia bacterium]|nr:hypothetical protein [Oligoflexia bacterium]
MKSPSFGLPNPIGYSFGTSGNTTTVSPSSAINFDQYLINVNVSGTQNNFLQNADIRVLTDYLNSSGQFATSTFARARPDAQGNWIYSSVNDSNHRLGQLMAYYWIDNLKMTANNTLPNSWHVTGKNVGVYSMCYDANGSFSKNQGLGVNAFWTGKIANFACMSYVGPFESAFDASVYDHEMGHANVDYGTNGQITQGNYAISCSFSSGASCCPSASGCAGAINEGQADVHSQIVFNSGIVGEFFLNNRTGLTGRDAELNQNLTAQTMFNGTAVNPANNRTYGQAGQEIHYMGGVWGTAWWTLRQNLGAAISDKIFFAHIELLTGNDTFKTALNAILSADQTLVTNGVFTTNHRSQILAAFQQHGITPP